MIWESTRLKYLAQVPIANGLGEAGAFDDPTWPRYVRTTDIAGPRTLREDVFVSLPQEIAARAPLISGDLVLTATGATIGKSLLYLDSARACYAGYLVRFRPRSDVDPRFISYWTESTPYWDQIRAGRVVSTIENFSAGKYRNMVIAVPDTTGQKAIANFLDAETARIDALLARKRRMVELLAERERVTSERLLIGLDVPGQDLGGWFAHTPSGWSQATLRHTSIEVQTGPFGSQLQADEYVEDGWPVLNPANLILGRIQPSPGVAISDQKYAEVRRHHLREGDILLARRGEMGRTALVTPAEHGWVCGTGLLRLRSRGSRLIPDYLALFLRTKVLKEFFTLASIGSTMENLGSEQALSAPVLVPPMSAQRDIVSTIQGRAAKVSDLAEKIERQIERLVERRQALITAAVTGQIPIPA